MLLLNLAIKVKLDLTSRRTEYGLTADVCTQVLSSLSSRATEYGVVSTQLGPGPLKLTYTVKTSKTCL